jgi:hypothetical protein
MLISFEFMGNKNHSLRIRCNRMKTNILCHGLISVFTIKINVKKKLFSETFGL